MILRLLALVLGPLSRLRREPERSYQAQLARELRALDSARAQPTSSR